MSKIKVACASLNQTPLDWTENKANILCVIDNARSEDVSVLVLPEMCITGYGCEDAFFSRSVRKKALTTLLEIAPATSGLVVSVGLPLEVGGALYDAACLLVDGSIAGFVLKQYLAGDGIHYEPRWFTPWQGGRASEVVIDGKKYPVGDLYFNVKGIRIGFEICEDAWVATRPGFALANVDVDLIINPSASHFAFGKYEERKALILSGSRSFCAAYLYANLVGNEAGRAIYDGGCIIADNGKVVAAGPRFSFLDYHFTSYVLDIDALRKRREEEDVPFTSDTRPRGVEVPFSIPRVEERQKKVHLPDWETSDDLKEEEFTRAVALGLHDYLRKSHSNGFVVSMSGGADSAATACLVYYMVHLAEQELGKRELFSRFSYIPGLSEDMSLEELISRLLLCVYQETKNNSATTRDAAAVVSKEIGATFFDINIDTLVETYTELCEKALGETFAWDTHNIALQNIQARVRGPSVWMFANVRNALLLATSNRSEAAVGYTTMDGDTCGGLSPIAGIDKAFLLHWIVWAQKTGPEDIGSLPSLAAISAQEPTAELRPKADVQRDEAELMPYEVLDVIERYAIRDKMMPLEVFPMLEKDFPEYSKEELMSWVTRFFKLWSRNQWKRERYAPSFHLDDENLDPKTWCRYPILSGGFEVELEDLYSEYPKIKSDTRNG